ncbi:MAG TPA: alpha-galactosidase [Candidatus Hydrogenedentes bacterium]|nr:alpha-galactosidase [Candidatus Hydrogenedentota bacterium]HPG69234.1 alpha-galactosidase [Candidatus Hydrogenedentota bacterium]
MLTMILVSEMVMSVTAAPSECTAADSWRALAFGSAQEAKAERPPFSFGYGATHSSSLLDAWAFTRSDETKEGAARRSDMTWTDPATGLECRCEVTRYLDFPAVEWVLYLKNAGDADTPILDGIQALDSGFRLPREGAARVHYANGSECRIDDFAPMVKSLGPNEHDPQGAWIGEGNPVRLESKSGRSSCGTLPFFNVDMGDHGVIGALGWTGDWAASFWRTDEEVRLRAGMRRTHLKLMPGEEIRSPRILLLFWEGSRLRGHNLLRQFILVHHSPQVNGKRAEAPITYSTWGGNFADKHIAHGAWWHEQGLPLDYLWVDAGWFGADEAKEGANVFNSAWWRYVGDWHANPGYFPGGLKPVGDALHEMGLGFLLWLESERVFRDTPWTREHPEWLLGPLGDNYLFNLGIPEARQMLTDFLSDLIDEGHIGCYRQDFNMDPRPYWEAADAPDRIGMAEIRHITGLYAMWDELLERHPGLLIDNCSSGGRRIDLETISRSMPLWRSDVQCWPNFGATAMQGQTHGLGLWVPLSTGCCDREDTYVFRSALGPGMVVTMYEFEKNTANHFAIPWLKERLDELRAVRAYFLGDFYPLLSFSLADDAWSAWQFDRPDLGEGIVLALRRPESPFSAMTPKLEGLDPDASYEIRNADTEGVQHLTGRELASAGLRIEIADQPGSKLLFYKKAP